MMFSADSVLMLSQLVEPDQPLTKGKIRDSNRSTLLAALKERNIPSIDLGIARDRYSTAYVHIL